MTTINPAIAQALAQLLAPLLAQAAAKQGGHKMGKQTRATKQAAPLSSKEDKKLAFELATVAAFGKAGFGTIVPNQDVLTYAKWEALGFRVKTGEHATRIKMKGMSGKGLPLFHKTQVEAIAGAAPTTSAPAEVGHIA